MAYVWRTLVVAKLAAEARLEAEILRCSEEPADCGVLGAAGEKTAECPCEVSEEIRARGRDSKGARCTVEAMEVAWGTSLAVGMVGLPGSQV